MARALLLSLLVRQHLALQAKFRARYPHPWLVWEAGAWNVPEATEQNVIATHLPVDCLRDCLPSGEAMCFELAASPERGALGLGRASHNTFVVHDATVSREHLLLHPSPEGGWLAEALARASSPVMVGGRRLEPEQRVPLVSGLELGLGDVRLTYHDADAFHARLGRIAAEVAAREAALAR
ncbi:FHA domain-containing protein [Myxococcaceae bacterium GXIMD 01537]